MMVFRVYKPKLWAISHRVIAAYEFLGGYKVESFTTSLTGRRRRGEAR